MILQHMAVPELMRFSQTSKRMQEMVYDDSRWVAKLRDMGCWNEAEARQRVEASMRRKLDGMKSGEPPGGGKAESGPADANSPGLRKPNGIVFDAGSEQTPKQVVRRSRTGSSVDKSFEGATPNGSGSQVNGSLSDADHDHPLHALDHVRSVRGAARQEYGRVYGALAPFYWDVVSKSRSRHARIFRDFQEPQKQARMLAQLRIFAKSDTTVGWQQREETLESTSALFENAALHEFEQAHAAQDVDDRMKKYAHVLVELNGGAAAVDSFIHNHRLMHDKKVLGNALDCIHHAFPGQVNLTPSRDFFEKLASALNSEATMIERIFPPKTDVLIPFLDRIGEEIITEYITPLFDEAHTGNSEMYLKYVAGVYEQSRQFIRSLRLSKVPSDDLTSKALSVVNTSFEPHVDLYLQEELAYFAARAKEEVRKWEKQLTEQEASAESFFMSNVNRQAVKRDFLTSFKKVLLMPVNVLPSISANKSENSNLNTPDPQSRSTTPNPASDSALEAGSTTKTEAPTTELAAKAAIMNSKLEGIASLFSIEVALTLVHLARTCIGRASHFVNLGGKLGEEAREQCNTIFCQLLQILGYHHVRPGFDKAVGHLSLYKAREATEHGASGVRPLVTFLELVNVGDLIQQMVDVFWVQELVATKLSDQDDFLNPALKEKKKFEQMLDERVAAGLNKGIDALLDEVDFILGSTQAATDFNPGGVTGTADAVGTLDIGPSAAAEQVVHLVSSHTSMLVGSTDKNLLDIFNQEVGLRLFASLCKHIKRQRISVEGSIKLIADTNLYFDYISRLKNKDLLRYFKALRELSQLFLVDGKQGKEIASIIADNDRYHGIFRAEEVYQFAERRADWYNIRSKVEKHMYGVGCLVM